MSDPSDDDDALVELPAEIPADKLFFRIGEAASLVGVEAHVLRYWENEFKLVTQRSSTGQRMYRRRDIADFMKIRKLLHEDGFTIAGARKALEDGDDPGVSDAPGGDVTRIKEAVQRLSTVRGQIAALRERYRAVGVAGLSDGS